MHILTWTENDKKAAKFHNFLQMFRVLYVPSTSSLRYVIGLVAIIAGLCLDTYTALALPFDLVSFIFD